MASHDHLYKEPLDYERPSSLPPDSFSAIKWNFSCSSRPFFPVSSPSKDALPVPVTTVIFRHRDILYLRRHWCQEALHLRCEESLFF